MSDKSIAEQRLDRAADILMESSKELKEHSRDPKYGFISDTLFREAMVLKAVATALRGE